MLTLTPITWTVRCGKEHAQYGDPYEGVATVQRCGEVAHVSAACGAMPLHEQIELSRLLKGMGFWAIIFERCANGEVKSYRRELRKPDANLTGEGE